MRCSSVKEVLEAQEKVGLYVCGVSFEDDEPTSQFFFVEYLAYKHFIP